jgi:AcrR family transcriptional regulator
VRPRKATDEQVFAAAGRVMLRVGPAQLTLAEIAAEAGLTAGALVQRFGSKRNLLRALSARAAASQSDYFAQLRKAFPSPLAAIYEYARCFAQMAESPATLAQSLAYLQMDMTDPEMRRQTAALYRATIAGFKDLLAAAIKARELAPHADPAELARTVQVMIGGSLMAWPFLRKGSAESWVRHDLEAVLRPYLPAAPPRKSRGSWSG